jgi:hypothetical protein
MSSQARVPPTPDAVREVDAAQPATRMARESLRDAARGDIDAVVTFASCTGEHLRT